MRKLFIGLSLAGIIIAVATVTPRGDSMNEEKTARNPKPPALTATKATQDPPGTIDGAVTPELIPDDVAYSLFFNFVAGRGTEKAKNSLKSYMTQVQLGNIDLEALMSTSDEYQRALNAIDSQSTLDRTSHKSIHDIETQLNELKQRKLALVNEKVKSLPDRLGPSGAENVRRHVMKYIKRKVKIIPGPVMPPTAH